MSAQTSWVSEALNRTASFEIPAALPANTGFDGDELCDRSSPRIVGTSAALRRVLDMVRVVAATDSTVLICGETGAGKDLIAHAVHKASQRCGRAFVKLNCAAIPLDLLESELFGHERGAFTGAIAQKIGRFEMADKGTLFLDEVGDIPPALQPKLLRVLQEQQFERLGSGRTHQVDVRLIAATNRDLGGMVARNEFRSDLYYRLNVFPVSLPPLRERREDIPALVEHFVGIFSHRMRRPIHHVPPETLVAFSSYSWPGNIRELQNLVERAVILSRDGVLQNPLPIAVAPITLSPATEKPSRDPDSVPMTLRDSERALILQALEATDWRIGGPKGAAERVGLKRTTLIYKMKKLGIYRSRKCSSFALERQSGATLHLHRAGESSFHLGLFPWPNLLYSPCHEQEKSQSISAHAKYVEELSYGPENRVAKSTFINKDRTHAASERVENARKFSG